jgi:hypothetical protein
MLFTTILTSTTDTRQLKVNCVGKIANQNGPERGGPFKGRELKKWSPFNDDAGRRVHGKKASKTRHLETEQRNETKTHFPVGELYIQWCHSLSRGADHRN